jgi:hypothetical protein
MISTPFATLDPNADAIFNLAQARSSVTQNFASRCAEFRIIFWKCRDGVPQAVSPY